MWISFAIAFAVLVGAIIYATKRRNVSCHCGYSQSTSTHPIVIVGGGPIGVIAANLLGSLDIPTMLIEKDMDICEFPRAGALHADVLRIFQLLGLQKEFAAQTHSQNVQFMDSNGDPLFVIRSVATTHNYPKVTFFLQPEMERMLRDNLLKYPSVSVHLGHEVAQLDALPTGNSRIVVRSSSLPSACSCALCQCPQECRFVLACDGGRSGIRKALGIPLVGTSFSQRWVVIDTCLRHNDGDKHDHAQTSALAMAQIGKSQRAARVVSCHSFGCDWKRPYVIVRLPFSHLRFEFLLNESEDAASMLSLEGASALIAPWVDDTQLDLKRRAVYCFQGRAMKQWRAGNVLFLGDAAHLMPPFAGQGLSSGARDALNLCWKLALVYRGLASEHLLCTYEQERRPDVLHMTRLAITLASLIQTRSRLIAAVRNFVVRRLVRFSRVQRLLEDLKDNMPLTRGLLYGVSAARRCLAWLPVSSPFWPLCSVVGQRLPQPVVVAGDADIPLDDVLGNRFVVLGIDVAVTCGERSRHVLTVLNGHIVTVSTKRRAAAEDMLYDRTGLLSAWSGHVLVVRPDQIVYAQCSCSEVDNVLTQLAHQLRMPTLR
eukprot:TRINITY_DN1013_c0_g1_i5.p1 TRINITY_DN1013_c0_g1~~TRINITY_DN1013_c0_g1_i5.p1  ORF type:complete len:600 (+),score=118.83 TRINITY_DN1013_c0_g1_i5:1270-3069(+)